MPEQSVVDTFLIGLLSPPGAGACLWLIVGAVLKLFPNWPSDARFWFTYAMAFVIPPGAYSLRIFLGYDVFSWEQLFLMIGVGFLVSQGVHRTSEKVEEKLGAH